MAVPLKKFGSPTYERYILDVLERAQRMVRQSKERIAESKKLQTTSGELLEEIQHRRIEEEIRVRPGQAMTEAVS